MTIKQLKKILNKFPQHFNVEILYEGRTPDNRYTGGFSSLSYYKILKEDMFEKEDDRIVINIRN